MNSSVVLAGGKYEFILDERGLLVDALRNGVHWQAGFEGNRFNNAFMEALWRIQGLENPTKVEGFGCIANTIKVAAGQYVDLANPDPSTIGIKTIAAALSKICRFGGHCPSFYSVAEHCIHAATLVIEDKQDNECVLAVLLHDATEAYLGDMVKPLKTMIPAYSEFEAKMEVAIEQAFDLSFAKHRDTYKLYDRIMLKAEKLWLFPDDQHDWNGFNETPFRQVDFQRWDPEIAEEKFLDLFGKFCPLGTWVAVSDR